MTKQELVQFRDSTYTVSDRRCETCRHFWHYGPTCQAIEIRGKIVMKYVNPAGHCELWEQKHQGRTSCPPTT